MEGLPEVNFMPVGIAGLITISIWLIAEIRNASKAIRIVLGLGIMFVLLCQPFLMNDVFVVQKLQYDACITRIAELLDQNDEKTVKQAMAVWNKDRGQTSIGNLAHVNALLGTDAKTK